MNETTLSRQIGPGLLTLYGLGTILGAGVYVLIGEVVGRAGPAAPSSFILAALLASVTALSFAELGSRIPRSAGEAAYVLAAFNQRRLSAVVGWAVVLVGTVSAATMVRGFAGYLRVLVDIPDPIVIAACVAALTLVAIKGIGESVLLAVSITVLEVAGLIAICIIAGDSLADFSAAWPSMLPGFETAAIVGMISGAFLAFYAFIGFEDIVNLAEEVRHPERNLPLAIVVSLVVATVLYVLVAIVATLAVPAAALAGNPAPLAFIVESRGFPPGIIAVISLFAVINGALVQLIMASRVLYGLACDKLAPAVFGKIHAGTRTPWHGTILIAVLLLGLSFFLSVGNLAQITSFVALSIFTAVNLALLRLKKIQVETPAFRVPVALPVLGAVLCPAMIVFEALSLFR